MTLIFIDDDPEDTEVFCEAVNAIDPTIECRTFMNGLDALGSMSAGQVPDIIFIDINMPKISGREVLRQIRQQEKFKHIKVVMFSTSLDQAQCDVYRDLGADICLKKPNFFRDLVSELRQILGKY